MFDILPFPHITGNTTEEQIIQLQNYLIQLKEELEFILQNISIDNLSDEMQLKLASLNTDLQKSSKEQEEAIAQIASSRALTVSDVINSPSFKKEVKGMIPENYIVSGEQTQTSTESGGTNIFTFTYANGDTSTFEVRNGVDGTNSTEGDI